MKLSLERVQTFITEECLSKGIAIEHIQLGCAHAEYLIEQNKSVNSSIKSGIAVAMGQHKRASYHN